jgi:acyl-coenzyme A synthetase/AMP-(fatty) acid ligase
VTYKFILAYKLIQQQKTMTTASTLYQSFAKHVFSDTNKIAIVDDWKSITYGELYDRVENVAKAMKKFAGICKGDIIMSMCGLNIESVELYLASMKMGCTFLPVGSDVGISVQYYLKFFEPKLVFINEKDISLIEEYGTQNLFVLALNADGKYSNKIHDYEQFLKSGDTVCEDIEWDSVDLDSTAWLLPTSGTTGTPKGVMHSYKSVQTTVERMPKEYQNQTYLTTKELTAISSMFLVAFATKSGMKIVLTLSRDADTWYQLIERHKISFFMCFANAFRQILDSNAHLNHDISSLKLIVYGGMKFPADVIRQVQKKMKNVELSQTYGMTEIGMIAGLTTLDHRRYSDTDKLSSCGTPVPHVQVKVVDKEGKNVPVGQRGQIMVLSNTVMTGYYKRPDLTEKAISKEGYMVTGDQGIIDEDGYVYVIDRIKDIIITDIGDNVYPSDVESIIEIHPSVLECIVFGVTGSHGMGETVHSAIVLKESVENKEHVEQEIQQLCGQYLTKNQRPSAYHFVDKLPQNTNQKYQRFILRDTFNKSDSTMKCNSA